jgi:hypothetical protein
MIRIVSKDNSYKEPQLVIEEVTDPAEIAKIREVSEQAERNGDWLQSHWPEILPHGLGKFLAVAGQQAFLADSSEEAIALARAAHPEDKGMLVHYLRPEKGPRIYALRG